MLFFTLLLPISLFSSDATIQSLHGNVEVITADGNTKAAAAEMKVSIGSEIRTQLNAYCDIAIDKDNIFRIKENTHIKIAKLKRALTNSDGSVIKKTQIDLFEGELNATLNHIPSDGEFDVVTPVAIAGATGTAFHVGYRDHNTRISVFDDTVVATSRNEMNKYTQIHQMHSVDVSPWEQTTLRAQGRGILSEALFGKQFTQAAESSVDIEATGTGSRIEEALLNAQEQLTILVLNLRTDPDHTIDQLIIDNHNLTEKLFFAISQAQVLKQVQNPDNTITARITINSLQISEILNVPLYGTRLNITPLSMMEYAKKFGVKARVTTERAAKVEGYRNLAEIIYGTVINSETTVEDFIVEDDTIRTRIQGVVQGDMVVNKQYFSDGSILVWMEINGDLIPEQLSSSMGDVFGINYVSSPQIIHFQDFHEYLRSN